MTKRGWLTAITVATSIMIGTMARAADVTVAKDLGRLAFGSCYKPHLSKAIFHSIADIKPDVFLWGGDSIYTNWLPPFWKRFVWGRVKRSSGYQRLLENTHIYGVWDDHDYGPNDSNGYARFKYGTKRAFMDFLDEPYDSDRRAREGIYQSIRYQGLTTSVLILLLDTRWFRDLNLDPRDKMLGPDQWAWLEKELQDSTDVYRDDLIFVMSGTQIISKRQDDDTWSEYPVERQRMIDTFSPLASKIVLLTGDIHAAEIAEMPTRFGPLREVTSSGMTHLDPLEENNPLRLWAKSHKNFAAVDLLRLNNQVRPLITIYSDKGEVLHQHQW